MECKNSPNKIVALAKDDDDDGGKPAFFIVINGQKIKTNDITESKGGNLINNVTLILTFTNYLVFAGLIVNLSKTSMIVEIIPGNYFSQIGKLIIISHALI